MCLSRSPLQVGAVAHNRSDRGQASKPIPRATPTASQNAAGSHRYHLCHLRCRSPDSAAYLGTRAHGALPLCIRQLCSFDAPPLPRRPAGRAPMTPPVSALRPPSPRVSCRCWCRLCGTTLVPLCARRLSHFAAPAASPYPAERGPRMRPVCARRAWLWRDAPPRLGSCVRSETGSVQWSRLEGCNLHMFSPPFSNRLCNAGSQLYMTR